MTRRRPAWSALLARSAVVLAGCLDGQRRAPQRVQQLLARVAGAIHRAHDRLVELVDEDPALNGTSTTATIAAYVSFGGLGRYIIDGLYQRNYEKVVGGATLVAAMALATLGLFWAVGRIAVSPGVRRRV